MRFEAYAEACIPETFTVLGLRLKPLSLGHFLLMRRLNCAFASDVEIEISFSDLLVAVLICSMNYEDCLAFFDLPKIKFWSWQNIKSFGTAWYYGKKLGPTGYEIRLWGREFYRQIKKKKDFNLLMEAKRFQRYITEGSQTPLYYEGKHSDDQKTSPAHWSIGLYSFLLTKYDHRTAMNLPLRQAFMEYCKWAEEQGAIELFWPYEEDMVKGLASV